MLAKSHGNTTPPTTNPSTAEVMEAMKMAAPTKSMRARATLYVFGSCFKSKKRTR